MTDFTRQAGFLCLLITETDALLMKILQNLSYQSTHPAGITAHFDINKSPELFSYRFVHKKKHER